MKPFSSRLSWLLALALLVFGLGLRLYDLTDQPLDFHPTRQLRGAIIARGIYYQMLSPAETEASRAVAFWRSFEEFEPPILETLVAGVYVLAGGEHLWIARIFSSIFWIVGGLVLYLLARRSVGADGALVGLAYYLILPFAVYASRSFQPDPAMTMWIVLTAGALYRWAELTSQPSSSRAAQQWKWAVLAGILGSLAILTKVVAVFIVGGAAMALVIHALGLKRLWRNPQVWVMAVLMIAPTAIYYLTRQERASQYVSSWTLSLSYLLLQPAFYVRWLSFLQSLMGFTALVLALTGVLIAPALLRTLLLGLWGGYVAYGLFLPYQMYTHNYYHIQLVPVISLSLVPLAHLIVRQLTQQPRFWRMAFALVALAAIAFPAWTVRSELISRDFRDEPAYWQAIVANLPADGKIIALTKDYGYRLMYYGWRQVAIWPISGERELAQLRGSAKEFETFFAKRIEGKSYFLIAPPRLLDDQPDLKQALEQGYPLIAQSSDFLLFDLAHPSKR
ncbi:MAG: glycosyltransferase family 39 protein [Chloroflexota bacterium]